MKRTILHGALFILICAAIVPGGVSAFEGLRGATWGQLRYDIPKEGEENLMMDGWIKQGVDWARWGNTSLNTYGTIRYKWDTERLDWNNSLGPGVGISIDTYSPRGIIFSIGAEYLWENNTLHSGRTDQRAVVYMSWCGWWDLKSR